jgi:hypothetical protein
VKIHHHHHHHHHQPYHEMCLIANTQSGSYHYIPYVESKLCVQDPHIEQNNTFKKIKSLHVRKSIPIDKCIHGRKKKEKTPNNIRKQYN